MRLTFRKLLPSIAARLVLALTLATTMVWCGAAAWSFHVSSRELNEAFDRALEETARRLLPLAADDVLGRETDDARAIHRFIKGREEYLSYQLRDTSGRVVLRSHDAPGEPFCQIRERGFQSVGNYRVFTDADETTGLVITVAETNAGRDEALFGAKQALLWPLSALVPLNILGIWLVVRAAMRPIGALSAGISARGGSNLTPFDISGQPDELKPIAEAIAKLLDRLRAALDAERVFAANSAHELRTPIAGALAQTQRMVAQLSLPDDRRRARDLEATLKRLSSLAEKLMQISRVDAGMALAESEVDVLPILDLVVNDCSRRLEEPARISYVKADKAKLLARIDVDAFAIAVRNLIDNAVNHGSADGRIEIEATDAGPIRIVNEGPVVTPQTMTGITRRFSRGESRSAGSGLGLAIAEAIITGAGGQLTLLSPAPGRLDGFEARMTLGSSPLNIA